MTDPNASLSHQRLRFTFAKEAQVKYISHLDLVLVWERALRRAKVPLAYSQGFNPRPKIQVASGLPVGSMGSAEKLDIIVTQPVSPADVLEQVGVALPTGVVLHSVEIVPLKSPALQNLLRQAEYRVRVETELPVKRLQERIEAVLGADRLIQTRRRKRREEEVDLRPWLHELSLEPVSEKHVYLYMRLTTGQFGHVRPEDILKALGLAEDWAEVERTRLIFTGDPVLD